MVDEYLKVTEDEVKVEFNASQINSVRKCKTVKNAFRCQHDGLLSTVCCVGDVSREKLLSQAKEKRTQGIPFEYALPAGVHFFQDDHDGSSINTEEMIDNLNDLIKKIDHVAPNFLHDGRWVEKIVKVELDNSLDTKLSYQYKFAYSLDIYRHKSSGNMIDGWMNAVSMEKLNPYEMIGSHQKYIDKFETLVDIENKIYPIVFIDNELIEGEVTKRICADKYFQNVSLFSNKLNEKIFHDSLTMYDINHDTKSIAWSPFDGDGYRRSQSKLPLFKNGEFVNLITDLRNAQKYSIDPTGNGYREYNSGVSIRPNIVRLEPGKRSFKEITKDIPELIVSFIAAGGDFLPNGDFSTPVQAAFLLKNGEVVGRLPQFQINSNLFDYLGRNLIEIASDAYQPGESPYLISQVKINKQ